MSQTTASVSLAELKNLVDANLELFGWEKGSKQHTVLSECILYAETRGNNQGVIKLVGPNAGFQMKKKAEQKEIEIVRNTKISALLNGNQNHGIYVLDQACEIALEKAKQIGIGIVGTFNTSNGTGALNYYASKICKHDMICVILSHGSGLVAPHGSYERKYGTNPICFGVPYGEEEVEGEKHKEEQFILFDMATSSIAFYQVMQHHLAGEKIPQPNLCYDPAGNLTDNPADVIEKGGAIRTFGLDDFKGNGLSFMVEILAGPLVQEGCADSICFQ